MSLTLAGEELLEALALNVAVVWPVVPVPQIGEAELVPEERDNSLLGLDFRDRRRESISCLVRHVRSH